MAAEIIPLPRIKTEEPPILAGSVVAVIEEAIIRGELAEGMRLTEEIISRRTGVSRSPIREALRVLEREGLLVREPRRGVRVSELSVDELDELYVCRVVLEGTASELATRTATDEEIERIRRAHEKCVRMLNAKDVLGHFLANVEMSQRIHEAAHNRPLLQLLGSIHKQALRYRYFAYRQSETARANSIRYNADFVAALARRDAPEAVAKLRLSIEASHAIIRDCLLARIAKAAPRKAGRGSRR